MKHNTSEKGQIVVVFIVALVVLLGLTALAIDGGMVYSDRRQVQSVADAAALAGGGEAARQLEEGNIRYQDFDTLTNAEKTTIRNQVCSQVAARASDNNMVVSCVSDLTGVDHGAAVTFSASSAFEKFVEVHVRMTTQTTTSFAHLFFKAPLTNTVDAVVRVRPRTPVVLGNAMVSLSPQWGTKTGGIDFTGGATVHITDGFIFSNSSIRAQGSYDVWVKDGSGTVIPGGIKCLLDCDIPQNSNFKPGATDICSATNPSVGCPQLFIQPLNIPQPACTSTSKGTASSGTINPGVYDGFDVKNGDTLILNPGLYCVKGGIGVKNGGTFTNNPGGVTIFLMKPGGDYDVNGGSINLTAPATPAQVTNGSIQGVVILAADGNSNEIKITGGAGVYNGMIYSRDGGIYARGNGIESLTGQMIGKYIDYAGGNGGNISFFDNTNMGTPPMLDLVR